MEYNAVIHNLDCDIETLKRNIKSYGMLMFERGKETEKTTFDTRYHKIVCRKKTGTPIARFVNYEDAELFCSAKGEECEIRLAFNLIP